MRPFISALALVACACVGAPPVPCTDCDGKCVDLATDSRNCGTCGKTCGAGSVCRDGTCGVSCSTGLTQCTDRCVNTQVDPMNCGGCGTTCQANETCSTGTCTSVCPMGTQLCSGGCVNVQTDSSNCGMCGMACTATQRCVTGTCRDVCGAGTTACPGAGGSTLCAQTENDPANCGGCGITCASGICSNRQCLGGATLVMAPDAGSDGGVAPINLSVTSFGSRSCAQGGEMVRYSVSALTATSATVTPAPAAGCLSPGDEVLLINQRGTGAANINVGTWELLRVSSVANDLVTFAAPKTKFYGATAMMDDGLGAAATNQRVTLQRVPVFTTFTQVSGTLTADAWDGTSGGIFALRATERISQSGGVIDMAGKGYAGGPRTTTVNATGQQGESIGGLGAADDRNFFGAGGGGRGENTDCGQNNTFGYGGGGAGHLFPGGRAGLHPCSGRGGAPIGTHLLDRILLGSGGAAGGADNELMNNPPGGAGGRGGGVVLLLAPTVTVSGRVDVSGAPGEGDGPGGCSATSMSTTSCWDLSGTGGGGAGGSFYTSALSFNGRARVRWAGGRGGVGGNGVAFGTNGGGGSPGRVSPLPVSCSDVDPAMGDGEYLFAYDGDPTRPYLAYCRGLGATSGGMYLTLPNQTGSANESVYPGTRWANIGCPGCSQGDTVRTRFQRVRFDPFTHRVVPGDHTFATTVGLIVGDSSSPTNGSIERVERADWGLASACESSVNPARGTANIDLRGTPFRLTPANVWTPGGFAGAGASTFSFDRQVASITGGGFCGDNVNRVFPFREHELEYFAPRASCSAVKTAYSTATDIAAFTVSLPEMPAFPLTCDLAFDGGGWALLNASATLGGAASEEAIPVVSGAGPRHLPTGLMRLIAAGATRVHLRTQGQANTRSFTTIAGSTPIVNLRLAQMLNIDPFSINDYQGPITTLMPSVLTRTCGVAPRPWPSVYHACGNGSGLHWLTDASLWQNNAAPESLELYVR
ncbi:MAG: hypothetical protein JNK82_04730 [Myxococcaceae bacterium]|nr:hypothetical protein [Myxococcaceae bacterium]